MYKRLIESSGILLSNYPFWDGSNGKWFSCLYALRSSHAPESETLMTAAKCLRDASHEMRALSFHLTLCGMVASEIPDRQVVAILLLTSDQKPRVKSGRPTASWTMPDGLRQSPPHLRPSSKKANPRSLAFLLADQRSVGIRWVAGNGVETTPLSPPLADSLTAPAFPAASPHPPAADRRSGRGGARGGPARIPNSPVPAGSRPSGVGAAV